MNSFVHESLPGRVVFGAGSLAEVSTEVERLGVTRVMLVASQVEAAIADRAVHALGDRVVSRFTDVVQHVPAEQAAAAVELARTSGADAVLTIGGGSATGFGKVVRLDLDVKFVAVPTTYAGSEMTAIWGRTDGDDKRTGTDVRVKPDTVVYDPELTLSLPPSIAGPSGMNALAHCVEALYAPGADPVVSLHALEGARALAAGLPRVCGADDGLDARSDVLYGAYLAGVSLGAAGTALHHKACHVLGGMFGLGHGDMNAVMLGHAVAYNAPAIPNVMDDLATALAVEADHVPAALFDLADTIGSPTSLEEIGMPADGIDEAARRIVDAAAANVRPPVERQIRQMLDDAFHGRRPSASRLDQEVGG